MESKKTNNSNDGVRVVSRLGARWCWWWRRERKRVWLGIPADAAERRIQSSQDEESDIRTRNQIP